MENSKIVKNKDHNTEFLNKKKLRLDHVIKKHKEESFSTRNNNKIKNEESSESPSDSELEDDVENYKNIISGKININNLISYNRKIQDLKEKEKKQTNLDEEKLRKINLKNLINKTHSLGFLPQPQFHQKDKSNSNRFLFTDDNHQENFFKSFNNNLINPDNLAYSNNEINNQSSSERPENIAKVSNVIDLNVNDIIDKNWELNYVSKLHKKELYKSNLGDISKDQKKTNHLKSIISDYKSKKDADEDIDFKIKSSKISTKKKYGW